MCGASASWRKNSFSAGMSSMPAGSEPRDRMWKLSRHRPSAGWSAGAHGVPGLLVGGDLGAPGERLVGDAHPVRVGPFGERRAAGRRARSWSATASGATDGAHQDEVRAQLGMTSNLRSARRRLCGVALRVGGVEVAERLVEVDGKAELGAAGPDLGGGERRRHEVRLEDLDAVEPGRRGGGELVLQRAGDADRGQRRAQAACFGRVLGGRPRAHRLGHGRAPLSARLRA